MTWKRRVNKRTEELMRVNKELSAEIEERKRFEAAIRLANHKINTLTGITRHDILNQITAIVMYLSLIREIRDRCRSSPAILKRLGTSPA